MALSTATAISQTLAKLHGNHTHRPFPTSIGKNPMLLHVSFPASIEKNPMLLHLSFPSSIEKNPPNKRIMAKSKDWSSHYNEARNQEDENICGAMAVVACGEAVHHMATGERVTLSARELVATGVQGSIRSCLAYTKVCGLSLEGPMNKGRKVFIDDYGWVKGESDTIRLLETQPAICVLALGSPKSPGDLTKYKGEAHCCSLWGHDFLPDYQSLGILKTQFPNDPVIALTATAIQKVQSDLMEMLHLPRCVKFVSTKFVSTVNRSNLFYMVGEKSSVGKVVKLQNSFD